MGDKSFRIATMPRYLLVKLGRYYVDEKWTPQKLDCLVPMPESLNLEHLRSKGKQGSEVELPEDAAAAAAPAAGAGPQADAAMVSEICGMGLDISENAAKRACVKTMNAGSEIAVAWYFDHMEDADINASLDGAPAAGGDVDMEAVAMLASMGFPEAHVTTVLKHVGGSQERAADWLFNHADDLDGAVAALGRDAAAGGNSAAREYADGVGDYELVGFVSHIGRNTSSGHYVCHKKAADGKWVIFDDSKVAQSEKPPLDLGYVYLYRRKDAK